MESQRSTQTPNDQIAKLSECMARMETKMDYVATHEASTQRWLLGITSTTMVAITAVVIRTLV